MNISLWHEIKVENHITGMSVCSDTSGFRRDPTDLVVPAESAGADSVALPQPCLVLTTRQEAYLNVLSVDGSVRMRSHCRDMDWTCSIKGLHGDRHLVFMALNSKVIQMDLSGRVIRILLPRSVGTRSIRGIGGSAAFVFVSSDNKIAAFSKETGQLQTLITLSQIPLADLRSLAIHGEYILVADCRHDQVHRVHIDTQQVVASHPTKRAGLARFEGPLDVAIDSRGRMFVSECLGHSVRALAADGVSLLWTLGVPGESGSGGDRLYSPRDLAVVTGGPCEQLVVADFVNQRLGIINLN